MPSAILQAVSDKRIRNDVNGIVLVYDRFLDDVSDRVVVGDTIAVSNNSVLDDVSDIVLLYDRFLDDISDTIAVSNNSVLWKSSCVRVLDEHSDIIVV